MMKTLLLVQLFLTRTAQLHYLIRSYKLPKIAECTDSPRDYCQTVAIKNCTIKLTYPKNTTYTLSDKTVNTQRLCGRLSLVTNSNVNLNLTTDYPSTHERNCNPEPSSTKYRFSKFLAIIATEYYYGTVSL